MGIFIIEITLHIYSYGLLYIKDPWNIADITIIMICLVLVLVDLFIDSSNSFRGFLKIRGIFRLLRIFILMRKLNTVRIRREILKSRYLPN